jgi:hypothetical protein
MAFGPSDAVLFASGDSFRATTPQESLNMRFALDSTPRKNRITTTRSHTVGRAAKTVVEALEGRQMLASVEAGQFAVFQGPGGQAVRINIGGSRGSLDFIGATRDQNGQARLNDIPMTIFDAGGNVVREQLGGFGGRRGINLADEVLNNGQGDSLFVGPTAPYTNVPSGRVNLDGLASNTLGKTYGVNSYPGGFLGTQVDILRVDSKAGNVVVDSEISDEILAQLQILSPIITKADIGAVTTDQQAVIGADFAQDDPNLLYFAMNVNFPSSSGGATPTITRTVTPAMFTYNLATKQVVLDQTLFGFNNAQDRIRIDDFTFLDDGRIAMFGSVALGQGAQPRVMRSSPTSSSPSASASSSPASPSRPSPPNWPPSRPSPARITSSPSPRPTTPAAPMTRRWSSSTPSPVAAATSAPSSTRTSRTPSPTAWARTSATSRGTRA